MINSIIPEYNILNIFSFLDILSLKKYDSAMTSKKYRSFFLYILKLLNLKIVEQWTNLRGIKHSIEMCKIKNLKYVSDMCTNLTVFGNYKKDVYDFINIENDNIINLRIDVIGEYILNNIKCRNLENIIIVNIYKINIVIFTNLKNTCPNVNKIIIITRDKTYKEEKINNIINNNKVKVTIKYMS